MQWTVLFHPAFQVEFDLLSEEVQDGVVAVASFLRERGPHLGRPTVDTLKGSDHANMKELRFQADGGVWRLAFAFDPKRRAVILCAGNKGGVGQARFYRTLIDKADVRFKDWMEAEQ